MYVTIFVSHFLKMIKTDEQFKQIAEGALYRRTAFTILEKDAHCTHEF